MSGVGMTGINTRERGDRNTHKADGKHDGTRVRASIFGILENTMNDFQL